MQDDTIILIISCSFIINPQENPNVYVSGLPPDVTFEAADLGEGFQGCTANLRTKILDLRGFDSSRIFI